MIINVHPRLPNGRTIVSLVAVEGEVVERNAQSVSVTYQETVIKVPLLENRFKAFLHLQSPINEVSFRSDSSNVVEKVNIVLTKPVQRKYVRLIYLLCKDMRGLVFEDGSFQGPPEEDCSLISAIKRIGVGALMMQHFYAQTLSAKKTFNLELNEFNEPQVHVLLLNKNIEELWSLDQTKLWEYVGKEILSSSFADEDAKYLAFCSFTRYNFKSNRKKRSLLKFSDMVKMTSGFVALGGGGLALLSTQCLYTWPTTVRDIIKKFCDATRIDGFKFMDDSCNRNTRGACFATTLGSCLHELSHTFNLGHADVGIMSRDFDRVDEFFLSGRTTKTTRWWDASSAVILASHKWFNKEHEEADGSVDKPFSLFNNIIKSVFGIVVVEYRNTASGNIVSHRLFTLPTKIVKLDLGISCSAFIIDTRGNMLKKDYV